MDLQGLDWTSPIIKKKKTLNLRIQVFRIFIPLPVDFYRTVFTYIKSLTLSNEILSRMDCLVYLMRLGFLKKIVVVSK